MKKLIILAIIALCGIVAWAILQDEESIINIVTNDEWTIEPGMVVDYGSNPMPVYQDDKTLIIAYENRATELLEGPSDKAKFIETMDGITYTAVSDTEAAGLNWQPPALELSDGTFRRFTYEPERGGVYSKSSSDNVNFTEDDGLRYEVESDGSRDPHDFGVSTYFVDSSGGVVLLYNVTDENGDIVVNRAYAADAANFVLTDEDILDGTLEREMYADPHVLIHSNGEIWLAVMNQDEGSLAPVGKNGTIYTYKSTDDGQTFSLADQVVKWDDFEEFDVYSLNDPKIIEFPIGTLRIVVAAMVEDDESESGFKWVLVNVHQ